MIFLSILKSVDFPLYSEKWSRETKAERRGRRDSKHWRFLLGNYSQKTWNWGFKEALKVTCLVLCPMLQVINWVWASLREFPCHFFQDRRGKKLMGIEHLLCARPRPGTLHNLFPSVLTTLWNMVLFPFINEESETQKYWVIVQDHTENGRAEIWTHSSPEFIPPPAFRPVRNPCWG